MIQSQQYFKIIHTDILSASRPFVCASSSLSAHLMMLMCGLWLPFPICQASRKLVMTIYPTKRSHCGSWGGPLRKAGWSDDSSTTSKPLFFWKGKESVLLRAIMARFDITKQALIMAERCEKMNKEICINCMQLSAAWKRGSGEKVAICIWIHYYYIDTCNCENGEMTNFLINEGKHLFHF